MNLSRTTLLLTRPEAASRRFAAQVESAIGRFGRVVVSPLMKIVPVVGNLPDCEITEWVFTSGNGVAEAVRQRPAAAGRAWCVGVRTAEAARGAGFEIAAVSENAAKLTAEVLANPPEGLMVHASGQHRRGDLTGELAAACVPARVACVYDQVACPLSSAGERALDDAGDVVAPVFSPRSARLLFDAAGARANRLRVVAISPAAAAEWENLAGMVPEVAQTPDASGILAVMGRLFDADRSA